VNLRASDPDNNQLELSGAATIDSKHAVELKRFKGEEIAKEIIVAAKVGIDRRCPVNV
jgi:hypothetical protein